jgi:hypothetical protein
MDSLCFFPDTFLQKIYNSVDRKKDVLYDKQQEYGWYTNQKMKLINNKQNNKKGGTR